MYKHGKRVPVEYQGDLVWLPAGAHIRKVKDVLWKESFGRDGDSQLIVIITDQDETLVLGEPQIKDATRHDLVVDCEIKIRVFPVGGDADTNVIEVVITVPAGSLTGDKVLPL